MSGLDRFRVRRCAKAGRMLRTIRHRGVTRTLLPDAVQHNARAHSDAKARGHLSLWTEAWPTQPNTVPEGKSVCRQKGDILPLRQVNANKISANLKKAHVAPSTPRKTSDASWRLCALLPGCLAASVALGSSRSSFEATSVVDADHGESESRSRRRRGPSTACEVAFWSHFGTWTCRVTLNGVILCVVYDFASNIDPS